MAKKLRLSASAMIEAAEQGDLARVRELIAAGAEPRHFATRTENAVTEAARGNAPDQLRILRELVASGCPVEGEALFQPASSGKLEVLSFLIEHGADVNAVGIADRGQTVLGAAAMAGHESIVRALIAAGADVQRFSETIAFGQKSPLLIAVEWKRLQALRALIEAGADVNRPGQNGRTALHDAAHAGDVEIVRALIDAGADVNQPDANGVSPLSTVRQRGHTDVVALLERAGATVPAAFQSAEDLVKAAKHGDTDEVRRALAAGASPDSIDHSDPRRCPALALAAENWHTEVVDTLLKAGAKPDATDRWGKTALFWAAYEGSTDTVRQLIAAGANVNVIVSEMYYGRITPLIVASENGHASTVELLLSAGADVSHRPSSGKTALRVAANEGHADVVRLLVDAVVRSKANRRCFDSPLWHAVTSGHMKCVDLLLGAGASPNASGKYQNESISAIEFAKRYSMDPEMQRMLLAALGRDASATGD
jgi:cytohesin